MIQTRYDRLKQDKIKFAKRVNYLVNEMNFNLEDYDN